MYSPILFIEGIILIIKDDKLVNTPIYCMLQMIAPDNGIIIDENIGLIGESDREISNDGLVATINNLGNDKDIRGEYFQVIDSDGSILFEPYIKFSAPLVIGSNNIGYCFFLKDYYENDNFESAFGEDIRSEAVVIYYNNKLYAKQNYGNKFSNNFIIDDTIELEEIVNELYRLTFNKNTYISSIINRKNNIHQFRLHNAEENNEKH